MAFTCDVVEITQPGATGNQTYNLPAGRIPKAVILFGTPQAADGSIASWAYSIGFGTYRGAVVQQGFVSIRGLDAATAADTASSMDDTALFRLLTQSAGSFATDCEISLVSMTSAGTPNVVLNWTNLHTTASIKLFLVVLGGSDISDALVGKSAYPASGTTHDTTVVAGFGKPDFLLASSLRDADGGGAENVQVSFGFGKQGEAGRSFGFAQVDGNTASVIAMSQRSDRIVQRVAPPTLGGSYESVGQLDTTISNWPTDGFRIIWDAVPSFASQFYYLALKGTFQSVTGAGAAPIAGGLPVVQDLACGFAPALGCIMGWNLAASSAINTTAADLGAYGLGFTDGTVESFAGFTEDDALGTMDSNQQRTNTKVIRNYSPAAVLQSEADGSFSGNNFRLSWNDIDTVAREYQWFALGSAAGGGSTVTFDATIAAVAALGIDNSVTRALAAVITGQGALTAAVARQRAMDASIAAVAQLAVADVVTRSLSVPISSQAALTADLSYLKLLAVAVAGQATLTPALTVSATVTLAADIQAQAQLAAAAAITRNLIVPVAAQGVVTVQADLLRGLAVSLQAQGQLTAAAAVTRALAVVIASQATVTPALTVSSVKDLAASIAAQAAVTPGLTVTAATQFATAITAQAAVTAALGFIRFFDVAVAGQATVSGALRVTRSLAVSIASLAQVSAQLAETKRFAVQITAQGVLVVSLTSGARWLIDQGGPAVSDIAPQAVDLILLDAAAASVLDLLVPATEYGEVFNSSFQADISGWTSWTPTGIFPVLSRVADVVDLDDPGEPDGAMLITAQNAEGIGVWKYAWEVTPHPVESGERIHMKAFAFGDGGWKFGFRSVLGWQTGAVFLGSDHPQYFEPVNAGFDTSGAGGKPLEGILTVPEGIRAIQLAFAIPVPPATTRFLRVDNVRFERINSRLKPVEYGPPNLAVDGSFESGLPPSPSNPWRNFLDVPIVNSDPVNYFHKDPGNIDGFRCVSYSTGSVQFQSNDPISVDASLPYVLSGYFQHWAGDFPLCAMRLLCYGPDGNTFLGFTYPNEAVPGLSYLNGHFNPVAEPPRYQRWGGRYNGQAGVNGSAVGGFMAGTKYVRIEVYLQYTPTVFTQLTGAVVDAIRLEQSTDVHAYDAETIPNLLVPMVAGTN